MIEVVRSYFIIPSFRRSVNDVGGCATKAHGGSSLDISFNDQQMKRNTRFYMLLHSLFAVEYI